MTATEKKIREDTTENLCQMVLDFDRWNSERVLESDSVLREYVKETQGFFTAGQGLAVAVLAMRELLRRNEVV